MASFLHDTPLGLLLRLCFGKSLMSFPDEKDGFVPTFSTLAPKQTVKRAPTNPPTIISAAASSHNFHLEEKGGDKEQFEVYVDSEVQTVEQEVHTHLPGQDAQLVGAGQSMSSHHILVTWYNDSDPENPRNWPSRKKRWVATIIW